MRRLRRQGPAPAVGVVHLGLGAFARAHLAVYTDEVDATGWGICGVTQRSATVRDQLAPQGGVYGVLTGGHVRIVGAVARVLDGSTQVAAVLDLLADPRVTVATLTVTEKGYRRTASGGLDTADPDVRADLAGRPPVTVVGRLVRGLQRRAAADAGPLTVVCCDNLPANGAAVERLVGDFCAALPSAEGDAVGSWIATHVTFPSSMVDRIVPATTDADRAEAAALTGVRDEGLVVAEPFSQWVLEDRFAAPRPPWERTGVQLTDDVTPYEVMKLRLLNGVHSTLAYLGALRGHRTIADAVADPALRTVAEGVLADLAPTVPPPSGVDLSVYGETVLARFADPGLRHTCVQVAMDGTQKLPQRLVSGVADALAAGRVPRYATLGVAAWMAYVALGRDAAGRELPLDDPRAADLASVRGRTDAAAVVDALLRLDAVFGPGLRDDVRWRDALVEDVKSLLSGSTTP
ncbi:mannitol dehydrogenase family protein [Cryptosporangium aurantiacum]|uniref:Mannitol-1-phosphate 5-dehydrogenase n=1 Tax=Cryptosporangium aurantiacum TaxID=134849 RepID=A0A1M7RP26_9ACTN|nr:mannitol dehydrogenase family protein [Cryptosporangium aurantiacum]SHN48097.1 fructuronate reductase [Cryptosporangium aurantiacum]